MHGDPAGQNCRYCDLVRLGHERFSNDSANHLDNEEPDQGVVVLGPGPHPDRISDLLALVRAGSVDAWMDRLASAGVRHPWDFGIDRPPTRCVSEAITPTRSCVETIVVDHGIAGVQSPNRQISGPHGDVATVPVAD